VSLEKAARKNADVQEKFISTSLEEHHIVMLANSSKLWDTKQGEAIDFGNLIHEMMAKIITKEDVVKVVNFYVQQGFINEEDSKAIHTTILEIVENKKVAFFFSEEVTVFNEREIVAIDNQIIIPDRLVFNLDNKAIIIDYKTGKPSKSHHQQLLKYEQVLKTMDFDVVKKILIYINDEITVEEV
jgi:hypothetical protein